MKNKVPNRLAAMQDHDARGDDPDTTGTSVDPRLLVISSNPFNAETRLAAHEGMMTSTAAFYVRNHFAVPQIDVRAWRLVVEGEVRRPAAFAYDELQALPSRALPATLECAGNGRSALCPQVEGEPWQYGAVSTAMWTGVPLRTLLLAAGMSASVTEIVCEGADRGQVAEHDRIPAAAPGTGESTIAFTRSLPLAKALHPDTLLAYAMNGESLPAAHGFPVRLIVPGWYGVASVKWITHLSARSQPFTGFFQRNRYVLEPPAGEREAIPLTTVAVRSLIVEPQDGAVLRSGDHQLSGFAWSGSAPVTRVEVSDDGGARWEPAQLMGDPEPYAWRPWRYLWRASLPGPATLRCRAGDAAGNEQPAIPVWNRLGYANNAIQVVQIVVAS
jgi:DMSO/TMAO reductase YedYZ molybdopterin-dependent catalytic subunit